MCVCEREREKERERERGGGGGNESGERARYMGRIFLDKCLELSPMP